ncbi:hypothetical protein AYI69_g3060 [Smittium culicis]|uniref:Uncharacterized protein n=1 Tax=Smittium culicis TaxID=133412 RepID=A0A1R1YKQ0_9FUNG|nr:hypothetical protein AYI69_g3060 [Smittium culicis]
MFFNLEDHWMINQLNPLLYRTRDINRFNENRSQVSLGLLNLVIVAQKEKRSGSTIENPGHINPETDPIL